LTPKNAPNDCADCVPANASPPRAEIRLLLLCVMFVLGFGVVGARMTLIAASEPVEPRALPAGMLIHSQRANITDRYGSILATNLVTVSLYAQPHLMVDKRAAADGLLRIFPDLDASELLRRFEAQSKFLWIKRTLSPEQRQAVHDLGEPGLLFGPRDLRLYPNGRLASHILGGASFGREGVRAAEIVGVAGVERRFDERMRDPETAMQPVVLSIDLSVQAAVERVLDGGMRVMNARGAAAVLMEADTGRIVALASLPDFDPNHRPSPFVSGDPSLSPLFNRAAQGRYELGSTFKIFTAALAMERGIANPQTMINTKGPLVWGKYKIRDFRNYGPKLSLTDVIVKSSNIGSARIAVDAGSTAQQDLLRKLGFFEETGLELPEARGAKPLLPPKWSELSTMTISYGHGIAATPVHLAAAYASLVNGGLRVQPTLLNDSPLPGEVDRVIAASTSRHIRSMLRQVVTRGTASLGEVEGYQVGGKTGTADKPKPGGGYYDEKVIATFASIFPASDPKYVLVVTLDEPEERSGRKPRRTAGWTAVPVAAEIIRRIAPLMGIRPIREPVDGTPSQVTLARN